MKFPRYWARGRAGSVACWRWSDASQADAQAQADARAVELVRVFEAGRPFDRYGYGDRPLREEIVQDLGAGSALVTRNLYGALVLNAARAMFIDIDFDDGPEAEHLERIRGWAARRPQLALRVYRTFAGLRGLVTSDTFDPVADSTIAMLEEIRSDPLYIRLCRAQASFRARLTPKPWRCASRPPPTRFPFLDAGEESRFRAWQAAYERASAPFATCRLVEQLGGGAVHADVAPILELHDRLACGDRPLA